MLLPRIVLGMLSIGMIVLGAGGVSGQKFPNKPIRIVTTEPGGGGNFYARLIAQGISSGLGQNVIVENRGGGILAAVIVTKASSDGYTLLLAGGSFTIGPLLQSMPYDPVRDFAPISLVAKAPNVLVVHPSLPAKSVKELIALANARPGELNYASAATGSTNHLAAELFKAMAHINVVRIPYKSGGSALNDLLAGQVQLTFGNAPTFAPHVKSGRLRALAVTSAEPSALAPGLPTVAASGLPGYEAGSMQGVFAPAKTPAAIINRLNQEVVRYLKTAEAQERFLGNGAEAVGSSPQEYAAKIKAEIARLGKVIKDAGIHGDLVE